MSLLRSSVTAFMFTRTFNKLKVPASTQTRSIARWVAPTLRELRKRAKKLGPQEPQPRAGFIEWNFRSELYAFGKRLHEEFQLPLLQTAFTQHSYILKEQQRQRELGIEETDMQMADNRELCKRGEHISKQYVQAYVQHSFPNLPLEGQQAISQYLLSTATLAHIASHLGMKELILDADYPPLDESLAHSLCAVIGALEQSSSVQRAFIFVRDFICTQLNQCDLLELWHIENPEELLKNICIERKLPDPEPRLIGDCGKNTVLAAYHVGIYANKEMIGKGFGEDIPTAVKTASLDALQTLFGIQVNMRPLDFQLQVEPKSEQIKQN